MIQEFEISITAVGGDQYLIRTENVAKGVQLAEEKVRWPVDQWLDQAKSLMHDPLLGLLQGQPRHTIPTSAVRSGARSTSEASATPTLVHLGQALHDELFKGQLHDSWVTAQGVAQNRQDLLRLRIGMKENRLQQLPWEALHAGTRPLATGTDVIFSRYILDRRQGHSVPPTKVGSGQVLRILMVIASPDDQERLELKQEVYHLQSELHPDSADQDDLLLDVQLKILEQPGRAELTQELERGNYQVLHYAGHSNLGNAGGDLYLVSRQTGLTERLSGEDLAGLLVNNGIKLAVFNSCRGGYSSGTEQGWQERNLAQALVNRGVPGVIAMTERIPDHVAITFTQLLYRNLKKGQSIDLSLNRTRQGLISAYG
ncbi:MAG: CHAT domain-containing protein, partial [Cyanobacteria bacterium J06553_1]